MRGRLAALLACACAATLACAGTVGADDVLFAPRIAVTSNGQGATTIVYHQEEWEPAPAVLTLYVPSRDEATLMAASGSKVGTVEGTLVATDLGGAHLPLTGSVTAAAAGDTISFGGSDVTLGDAATACIGTPDAAAYWVLNLTIPGLTIQLPIFASTVEEGRFAGGLRLSLCPAAPGTAPGTRDRALLGAKLLDLSVTLDKVLDVPAGWQQWYLQATPYVEGTSAFDAARSVEAQTQDRSPQELTLNAKETRKSGVVRLSGRLEQGGRGVAGQRVRILIGKRAAGHAKTDRHGRYSLTRRVTEATTFTAAATVRTRDKDCADPAFAPLPCVSATIGGFVVASDPVRVKPS